MKKRISYVIINPSYDLELQLGDIVYVVRAPVDEGTKTKKIDPRIGMKKRTPSQEPGKSQEGA